jgi:transcriptional regulator with XRE-family HTH domain
VSTQFDMNMRRNLSFVAATDQLAELGVSLGDIAERFGVRRETVSRWRRETGVFAPPENWRDVVANLAAERGIRLSEFAEELRRN